MARHPPTQGRRLLAAPDKFRGTATAAEVAEAIERAAGAAGWSCDVAPVSDGGEGFLACLGGANRTTTVSGPLGDPVRAPWRLVGSRAVIETAVASGLLLVAGRNDPMRADTGGTGRLIAAAIAAGATEILVGVGGSASTDGGLGAVDELRPLAPLDGARGARVLVAADVSTLFLDAATVFAPQKGADPHQVTELTARLERLAARYRAEFGIDVTSVPGSGAGGGLAGGLAALGAAIQPGIEVVADQLRLAGRIAAADLVITGEGRFDATSGLGKADVGLVGMCRAAGIAVALIVGSREPGIELPADGVVLEEAYGRDAARTCTGACVTAAATRLLSDR